MCTLYCGCGNCGSFIRVLVLAAALFNFCFYGEHIKNIELGPATDVGN